MIKEVFDKIDTLALWEGFEILRLYSFEDTVIYIYDTDQIYDPISHTGFECIGYSITAFANAIYQSDSFLFSMLEYGDCVKQIDFPYMDYFHETASLKEHLKKASRLFLSMKKSKTWDVKKAKELIWHIESLSWISVFHKPSPLSIDELMKIQADSQIQEHMISITQYSSKRMDKDNLIADYAELQLQAFRYRLQSMRMKRKDKKALMAWINTYLTRNTGQA